MVSKDLPLLTATPPQFVGFPCVSVKDVLDAAGAMRTDDIDNDGIGDVRQLVIDAFGGRGAEVSQEWFDAVTDAIGNHYSTPEKRLQAITEAMRTDLVDADWVDTRIGQEVAHILASAGPLKRT